MKAKGSVSDYEILEQIGRSKCAQISKAICKETQQVVAIKELYVNYHESKDRDKIITRFHLCEHRNLLKYYNYFYTDSHLYVIMELCSGSFDQIIECFRPLNEKEISAVLRRVLEGLISFSENDFEKSTSSIHSQNILFDSNNEIKI